MTNKLHFILLFCFAFAIGRAQDVILLQGKVVSGRAGVSDAYVINKITGLEAKTKTDGTFAIIARPEDVLIVYNAKIMVREFKLNAGSFKDMPYVISVNYNANASELDEVVITKYGNINSESLGIAPKNQKRYTVAERRLYTAGYGSISLFALINVISGRMAMLKRAYATEKKEMQLEKIKGLYDEEDINEQFNIPREQVNGFMYYLVENEELLTAVKSKNKSYTDFLILGLSKEYLKMQQEGK